MKKGTTLAFRDNRILDAREVRGTSQLPFAVDAIAPVVCDFRHCTKLLPDLSSSPCATSSSACALRPVPRSTPAVVGRSPKGAWRAARSGRCRMSSAGLATSCGGCRTGRRRAVQPGCYLAGQRPATGRTLSTSMDVWSMPAPPMLALGPEGDPCGAMRTPPIDTPPGPY
jgi:hypothetical protein